MYKGYGGRLVGHVLPSVEIHKRAVGVETTLRLNSEDLIHLINLATGIYSPLTGFMSKSEYYSVLRTGTLQTGLNWPLPIVLSISEDDKVKLQSTDTIVLESDRGALVGLMGPIDYYRINRADHAKNFFGTDNNCHPGVRLFTNKPNHCIGGDVYLSEAVLTQERLFRTPIEIRNRLKDSSLRSACAFSTRNICHLGHEYLHGIGLEITDLLGINVITGPQLSGTFKYDVVFDTYEYLIEKVYPEDRVFLNNLRIPATLAGPKEAFLQAIMLQNLGFTHFIVGRDHAGIANFYGKYDSQNLLREVSDLEIDILAISEPRYCNICCKITTERTCKHNDNVEAINGRDIRRYLQEKLVPGTPIEFLRKELVMSLNRIVFSDSRVNKKTDGCKKRINDLFWD